MIKSYKFILFIFSLFFLQVISMAQIPNNDFSQKNVNQNSYEKKNLMQENRQELRESRQEEKLMNIQERQNTRELNQQERQETRLTSFCERSQISLNNRKERVNNNIQKLSTNFDKTNSFINNKITEFQTLNLNTQNLENKMSELVKLQDQIISEQSSYSNSLNSFDTNLCLSDRKSYIENLKKLNSDTKNSRTKFGTYTSFLRSQVITEVKKLQESLNSTNE